jgi:hypothetical protein
MCHPIINWKKVHSVVQVYAMILTPIIEDECPLSLPAAPNVPPPQSQHDSIDTPFSLLTS